jgi:hypothetical protein
MGSPEIACPKPSEAGSGQASRLEDLIEVKCYSVSTTARHVDVPPQRRAPIGFAGFRCSSTRETCSSCAPATWALVSETINLIFFTFDILPSLCSTGRIPDLRGISLYSGPFHGVNGFLDFYWATGQYLIGLGAMRTSGVKERSY